MKKIWLILAILGVAVSVSACSNSSNSSNSSGYDVNQPTGGEAVVPLTNPAEQNSNSNNTAAGQPAATSVGSSEASSTVAAATTTPANTNITMLSPDQQPDLTKTYSQAVLQTNLGNITLKFYAADAHITVNNFLNLAHAGFYNGVKFHRVIKGFMIQSGDPLTKGSDTSLYGTGGPGYQFKDEYNNHTLVTGTLAMANSGVDTNGSQFFIVTSPTELNLQGHYTIFGEVASGLDVVTKIENVAVGPNPGNPAEMSAPTQDIIINKVELLK
jgi:cyclophilin family peptidyl-prolyl cis-trans isomerase